MNWLQLIERRVSVRRYQTDIEEGISVRVGRLCEHAATCNSSPLAYHLLPGPEAHRHFRSIGVKRKVIAPWYAAVVSAQDKDSLLNVGYSAQRLVLQLTDLGLGTCWLGSLFDREALASSLELGGGLGVKALIAFGRGRQGAAPGGRRRLPPQRIGFTAPGADRYPWRTVLEAVRWAPSALNRQPWRLWLGPKAIHLYGRSGVIARSYTPIEMGIALCHLELACRQLGAHGRIDQGQHPRHRNWEYWVSFLFD